ncbi:hypothetical protein [Burkholderia seminalis]|uniref:hypothetical protein n=1 Tax=Burkholderia seminalis TaxID=488731 RepID=UPI00265176A4|nr:hypothetical protein [Burkholderia seminalis]MDN7590835.1 hypothetical protein [Burkholderia seminalis]
MTARFANITPIGQPTVSPASAVIRSAGRFKTGGPGITTEIVEADVIAGNAGEMISLFPPGSGRTRSPAIESKSPLEKPVQPVE